MTGRDALVAAASALSVLVVESLQTPAAAIAVGSVPASASRRASPRTWCSSPPCSPRWRSVRARGRPHHQRRRSGKRWARWRCWRAGRRRGHARARPDPVGRRLAGPCSPSSPSGRSIASLLGARGLRLRPGARTRRRGAGAERPAAHWAQSRTAGPRVGWRRGARRRGALSRSMSGAMDWNFAVAKLARGRRSGCWSWRPRCSGRRRTSGCTRRRRYAACAVVVALYLDDAPAGCPAARSRSKPRPAPPTRGWSADPSFRTLRDWLHPPRGRGRRRRRPATVAGLLRLPAGAHQHRPIGGRRAGAGGTSPISARPPAGPRPPHVFVFVVDSLRRDYLSPYNDTVTFTPWHRRLRPREHGLHPRLHALRRHRAVGAVDLGRRPGPAQAVRDAVRADEHAARAARPPPLPALDQHGQHRRGDHAARRRRSSRSTAARRRRLPLLHVARRAARPARPDHARRRRRPSPGRCRRTSTSRCSTARAPTASTARGYDGFHAPYASRVRRFDALLRRLHRRPEGARSLRRQRHRAHLRSRRLARRGRPLGPRLHDLPRGAAGAAHRARAAGAAPALRGGARRAGVHDRHHADAVRAARPRRAAQPASPIFGRPLVWPRRHGRRRRRLSGCRLELRQRLRLDRRRRPQPLHRRRRRAARLRLSARRLARPASA